MAGLLKYFKRIDNTKPTNSLLTTNEIHEADKKVAKVLDSTSKTGENTILTQLSRGPRLESMQRKMVQ